MFFYLSAENCLYNFHTDFWMSLFSKTSNSFEKFKKVNEKQNTYEIKQTQNC